MPYFLAEFASAALEINRKTADLARNVLREQLVGAGLQVPLATNMVIKDYGSTEAPHAAPEWCNTHVLYHALCDEDVPELELSNSLNVVLQALEKVTSKGRGRPVASSALKFLLETNKGSSEFLVCVSRSRR